MTTVAFDRRPHIGRRQFNRRPIDKQIGEPGPRLAQHHVEGEHFNLPRPVMGHHEQAARNAGCTIRGVHQITMTPTGNRILAKYVSEHIRLTEDNREQIIEIVRHAAGDATERFHSLRALERLLRTFEVSGEGGELGGEVEHLNHRFARRAPAQEACTDEAENGAITVLDRHDPERLRAVGRSAKGP